MALVGWQATIQDDNGNVISGGSVEVRSTSTGTPLATLFSDREGSSPLTNPFGVLFTGFAQFFVESGQYTIAVTANGSTKIHTADLLSSSLVTDLITIGTAGAQYSSGGPVATATTANITLSGEQTIDGVLTSASRVLVKNQTAPEENGIYVSAAGAWARAADMDAAGEVQATAVYVAGGTTQGGRSYATYSEVTTLGTDAISFVQIGANDGVQGQIDVLASDVDGRARASSRVAFPSLSRGIAQEFVSASGERVAAVLDSGEARFPGSPTLDALHAYLRTTAAGYVLEGVRHDGALTLGPVTHSVSLSPAYVEQTKDLAITTALRADGVDLEAANYDAWVSGGAVWADVRGVIQQVTGGADTYVKADIRGSQISLVKNDNTRITSPLGGRYPQNFIPESIEYSDMYGQSNASGSASGALINDAPFNDRFWMFNGGQRTFGNDLSHGQLRTDPIIVIPEAMLDFELGYEQLVANTGETANSGFAHHLLGSETFDASAALITTCSGIGSANAQMLVKDSVESAGGTNDAGMLWSALEAKFIRAALFWKMQGKQFITGPLRWNQGEGNYTDTKATYLARLVTLRDDWQALAAEWQALRGAGDGGFSGKAPLITTQMCSGAHYGDPESEVPFAQLQINLDDPTTALCCGPTYDQAYAADGVHLLAAGQEVQGVRQAIAYEEWLKGNSWRPLHVSAASRVGTIVTLTIHNHFNLPLVMDTTTITGLGAALGFSWHDNGDGNSVTVDAAAVTNNTTVEVTLSAIPTGTGGAIGIGLNGTLSGSAGPSSGNRCALRTNGSTATTRGGTTVEHFLCIDRVTVS